MHGAPSCTRDQQLHADGGQAQCRLSVGCLQSVPAHPLRAHAPPLQAVIAITADWKNSFRQLRAGVVAAQVRTCPALGAAAAAAGRASGPQDSNKSSGAEWEALPPPACLQMDLLKRLDWHARLDVASGERAQAWEAAAAS